MLYKYCKIEYGFDILLQSKLKVSFRKDFNDPFELQFSLQEETALDNIKNECNKDPENLKNLIANLKEQNISYNENSLEDIFQKGALFSIKQNKKILNSYFDTKGIICFSEKPDIIQMWAHYTENHKGIVIGIDENDFVKDKKALIKIDYKDEMVRIPIQVVSELSEDFKKCIVGLTKRKESKWVYEKEVRFYMNVDEKDKDADGKYSHEIPTSSIKEIYLGLRAHETTEMIANSIRQKKEYSHLKIYKMHRHESEYKLKPQEI